MNNDLSPTERDELASAYLDGEATKDEIVLIEGDPKIMVLVEELRAAVEVSLEKFADGAAQPDADLRAAHLTAALAEFDLLATADSNLSSNVTSLSERAASIASRMRGRRAASRQSRGYPRWLSAAAVSLSLLGGIGVLVKLADTNSDTDSAAEVFDGADESSGDNSAMASALTAESSEGFAEFEMETEDAAEEALEELPDMDGALDSARSGEVNLDEEAITESGRANTGGSEIDLDTEVTTTIQRLAADTQLPIFPLATSAKEILEALDPSELDPADAACAVIPLVANSAAVVEQYYRLILSDSANGPSDAELLVFSDGTYVLLDATTCAEIEGS